MAVYVDDARISFRGMHWSHLVADGAEELHRAAEQLGLRREWAQDRGRTLHYDLPDAWRKRAIDERIAKPITWRELVRARHRLAAGVGASRSRAACTANERPAPLTSGSGLKENRTIARLRS